MFVFTLFLLLIFYLESKTTRVSNLHMSIYCIGLIHQILLTFEEDRVDNALHVEWNNFPYFYFYIFKYISVFYIIGPFK
ncbi:hypothetical protein HanRHA438_Chr06g0282701 [Helianthus annuus]|nr:hypothetical protein HanRHA438_Chr06g0282701 [Helianthus annuus]